jgi:Fic family protein
MADFAKWLEAEMPSADVAFDAHLRLVAIHPFAGGNGRTARLLMNLILIRAGYPPIAVRPADRMTYLDALENHSANGQADGFHTLMWRRLNETMTEYLGILTQE